MTLPIASSTFTAGPKDDLASPDIYKLNPKKLINSIPVKANQITDLFSSISTKSGQFDIKGTLDKVSKTDIGNTVLDSVKELGANARELGSDITAKATTFLEKAAPGAKALSCKIGDYTNSINWKDVKEGAALVKAVQSVSGPNGVSNVINKAANTGIFSGMIEKAGDLGVTGVFDSIKTTVVENGLMVRMAKAATPYLLSKSNVKLLDELTRGGMGKALNTISPGFTKAFTSVYKQTGSTRINKITTFNGLIDSFDRIDSDWDKLLDSTDGGASIVSLLAGSNAFKSIVYSGIMYGIDYMSDEPAVMSKNARLEAMAMTSLYRESTVSEQIARYFPNTVMIGRYDQRAAKEETVDMSVLNMDLLGKSIRSFLA